MGQPSFTLPANKVSLFCSQTVSGQLPPGLLFLHAAVGVILGLLVVCFFKVAILGLSEWGQIHLSVCVRATWCLLFGARELLFCQLAIRPIRSNSSAFVCVCGLPNAWLLVSLRREPKRGKPKHPGQDQEQRYVFCEAQGR